MSISAAVAQCHLAGVLPSKSSQKDPNEALFEAVQNGDTASVSRLLNEGATIQALDEEGYAPLHRAVMNRNPEMVKLLLDRGAPCQMKGGYYGSRPLSIAISGAHAPTEPNIHLGPQYLKTMAVDLEIAQMLVQCALKEEKQKAD